MVFNRALSLVALLSTAFIAPSAAVNLTGYEFIIVGSGAGGGPLAAGLAMAGHKTLLIEAGDDQGANLNVSVPAFQAKSTEDPALAWEFFVRHYKSDERQSLDYKTTYITPSGAEYTGLDPPPGSVIKGVLYPRTQALGGCTEHNALVSIYPDRDDFQYIVNLTGDNSWNPDNMRKYFVQIENNNYLPPLEPGHGYFGWFHTQTAPLTLAIEDKYLFAMVEAASAAMNKFTGAMTSLLSIITGDANADTVQRDQGDQVYQIPISSNGGQRWTVRDLLINVSTAKDLFGNKKYPLDIRLNCYVTKVTFDTTGSIPKATGVEFLDGQYLYRASPRSSKSNTGTPGSATASREVIVAGGSYNSPQILKLSGIGPAAELEQFNIPVIKDLPGVGTNLQDHYEVAVQSTQTYNYPVENGCTFGYSLPDPCLNTWEADFLGNRGTYASSGFAAAMFYRSSTSPDGNYDELAFGGPVNFRGYFPGYAYEATEYHNIWTWALLKSHPRNTAGAVTLNSSDPLDTPNILFNYFDTGSGNYSADLETIYESIELARLTFQLQTANTTYTEVLPGSQVQSREDIETYIKNTAWGHHCSCTCPIGADNDPMAVLDSSFRVRGVSGLRVVDASSYPRIPGTFTLISTYLVGVKAVDVILSQLNTTST